MLHIIFSSEHFEEIVSEHVVFVFLLFNVELTGKVFQSYRNIVLDLSNHFQSICTLKLKPNPKFSAPTKTCHKKAKYLCELTSRGS